MKQLALNPRINITADNIDYACQRNSHRCMIADAIHTRFPWATFIEVDVQSIRFNDKSKRERYIYLTPPEAQKAIILFDQGIRVKPFSFTLSSALRTVKRMNRRGKKSAAQRARKNEKPNPSKKTPPQHREFGLRGFAR